MVRGLGSQMQDRHRVYRWNLPYPSSVVIVGGIPSCVSFGGVQLLWHLAVLPHSVLLTVVVLCIPVTQESPRASLIFSWRPTILLELDYNLEARPVGDLG